MTRDVMTRWGLGRYTLRAISTPPIPAEPFLPAAPEWVSSKLGSLEVVVAPWSTVPMVEMRLVVELPTEELKRPARTTVLAESMMAGTAKLDRAGLATAVEKLGGDLDAAVHDDHVVISGSVLAGQLGPYLDIVREVLEEATYPQSEVDSDRHRLAEEATVSLSQPEVIVGEALARRLFGRHPYSTPLPRPQELIRVSAGALRSLHSRLLRPERASLVLVGAIDPEETVRVVGDALGSWAASDGLASSDIERPAPPKAGPVDLVEREGAVQTNIRLGRLVPARQDADWPAFSLVNMAFGGMFSSRLVESLRERHGYTYSPHSRVRHARAASALVIQMEVATEVTAPAMAELLHELARCCLVGFRGEEVDNARRYALGSFAYSTATQAGMASTIASLVADGTSPSYLRSYPEALREVSVDEVNAQAARYLVPQEMVKVLLGDASRVEGPLAKLFEVKRGLAWK